MEHKYDIIVDLLLLRDTNVLQSNYKLFSYNAFPNPIVCDRNDNSRTLLKNWDFGDEINFLSICKKKGSASSSGQTSSSNITKLTWARIAARFVATGECSPCTDQVPPKSRKREKLVSARLYQKKRWPQQNRVKNLPSNGNGPSRLDSHSIEDS